MSDAALHPPRPRLVLRVGVTGHRPGASLPAEATDRLRRQIRAVLSCASRTAEAVRRRYGRIFSDEAPLLVAVSALAEGGDRMLAEEALGSEWVLDAVLPRRRGDYARDFATEASQAKFRELLERARAVFEIDDQSSDQEQSASYETAGLVMLDHSDLLVAIWDGEKSRGRGGTREIVDEAVQRAIPVLWIDTLNETSPALWNGKTRTPLSHLNTDDCEADSVLADAVQSAVAPPSGAGKDIDPIERLEQFLDEEERRPPFWSGAYQLLLCLVAGKRPVRPFPALVPIANRAGEWKGFIASLPPVGPLGGSLDCVLLRRYLWADRIATELGHIYRSAYVLNFLFSALAVASGLFAIFFWNAEPDGRAPGLISDALQAKTTFAAVELLLIVLIVIITIGGERAKWHQRFLDSRRLAEMLRHGRVLAPVGRAAQSPIDKTAADAGELWTAWYAQATLRELPLPNACADAAFLGVVADATVKEEVEGQIDYHERNAKLLHQMHERLDVIGYVLFVLTLLLCVLWFILVAMFDYEMIEHHGPKAWVKPALTYFGAVFPAFAAALAGIRAQGDFLAFSKRSHSTEKELRQLRSRLQNPKEVASYRAACLLLRSVADTMASDLGTWRLVYRNHPLTIPG